MTTTQINRRTGRREVHLHPEPETTGRTAATPCPPRLYPLVWYAREACAAALETGHDKPVPGHSVPSHVVSFPLRFSQWQIVIPGYIPIHEDPVLWALGVEHNVGRDGIYFGTTEVVRAIEEERNMRQDRLIQERGEAVKRAREMRPEHVDSEAWEAEIVAALREHEEAEDVLAALEVRRTGAAA